VQFFVQRGPFFARRLEFFVGRFELFARRLKLLVRGHDFLVQGAELFVRSLVLVNHGLQVRLVGGQFLFELADPLEFRLFFPRNPAFGQSFPRPPRDQA
jgi:hypothetical protein